MTNCFKSMCVCNKCGVAAECQQSLNAKRLKVIQNLNNMVARMRDSPRKTVLITKMKKYEGDIMVDSKLKYDHMLKMIDEITCQGARGGGP